MQLFVVTVPDKKTGKTVEVHVFDEHEKALEFRRQRKLSQDCLWGCNLN